MSLQVNLDLLNRASRVANMTVTSALKEGRDLRLSDAFMTEPGEEKRSPRLVEDPVHQLLLDLCDQSYIQPLEHSFVVMQVIWGLLKKGKTIDSFTPDTKVKFTNKELDEIAMFRGKPFNREIINNQFVNEVVKLLVNKNETVLGLYKAVQLRQLGLQGTIRGTKPATIDLEPLSVYYCGSGPVRELQVGSIDDHANSKKLIFPRELPEGLTLHAGGADFVSSKDETRIKVKPSALLSDSAEVIDQENIGEPIKIKGLELTGKDGGKRFEVNPTVPTDLCPRIMTLPLYIKSLDQVQIINLRLDYKKR